MKGSLRQRMEQHRTNPVCSSCHTRMDTLGFGLENYDGTGKWRLLDGKFEIDASGTLPNGKSFKTPSELRTLLRADLPAIARCITEKMLTYSLGRGLERYDRKTVNQIVKNLSANDYKFQTLVYEIVHSLPYQSRRGEALRTETAPKPKEIASR